jgi:hypothetical protein
MMTLKVQEDEKEILSIVFKGELLTLNFVTDLIALIEKHNKK